MTGVFVWAWVILAIAPKAEAVFSTTAVVEYSGQMSARSADTGQQSERKGDQVSRVSQRAEVEMVCEATMSFLVYLRCRCASLA
jgi:hypothetical protein